MYEIYRISPNPNTELTDGALQVAITADILCIAPSHQQI